MERRSITEYVAFGASLRYLQDAVEGMPIHGKALILWNLGRFLNKLKKFQLSVTDRAAHDLRSLARELFQTEDKAVLSAEQVAKLKSMITVLRITLESEVKGIESFFITPKIIDVTKLLDGVPSLFAPGVFNSLPVIARYDFSEAGKCIAFERPTAAAFHTLRGTEDCLKHFYCSFIRRKRVKDLMWGPMVNDLRANAKTKKFETLNNNLDNIRLSFRNPTQHPEKIYDIHEVQDLWSLCVEVVNRMCRILKEEEQKKKRKPKA
jgi:hypothetical protein